MKSKGKGIKRTKRKEVKRKGIIIRRIKRKGN